MPLFTVFTPTLNRAHTLRRCFDSLRDQTFQDFEWVVVDDGSTDGSASMIEGFRGEADFPISVIVHDKNRGKHAASNTAVQVARGELFLTLDSDDWLPSNSLATFARVWRDIPDDQRQRFAAVTGLCENPSGQLLGTRYPRDVFHSTTLETRYRYRVVGDKFGFTRTDVMRSYPFPEGSGIDYVPEGIVWNAIGARYLTRYVNEVVLIKDYQSDGFTRGGRAVSDAGVALYLGELLNVGWRSLLWSPRDLWATAWQYASLSSAAGLSASQQWADLGAPLPRGVWLVALPLGRLHSAVRRSRFKEPLKRLRDAVRHVRSRR